MSLLREGSPSLQLNDNAQQPLGEFRTRLPANSVYVASMSHPSIFDVVEPPSAPPKITRLVVEDQSSEDDQEYVVDIIEDESCSTGEFEAYVTGRFVDETSATVFVKGPTRHYTDSNGSVTFNRISDEELSKGLLSREMYERLACDLAAQCQEDDDFEAADFHENEALQAATPRAPGGN
jgi:hypothetical protein